MKSSWRDASGFSTQMERFWPGGDFLEIYAYAEKKGLLITLFTNGTLITREVADHLAMLRPFRIEITIYGPTRETYERVTGIPDSFERCLRGIHLLRERGLPLILKTSVLTINKNEVWDLKRFSEESLGFIEDLTKNIPCFELAFFPDKRVIEFIGF